MTGAGLSFLMLMPLARRLWPEDMAWYWLYVSRLRYRCDYDPFCRAIGVFCLLMGMAPIPSGMNGYTQVREDSMAVHRFIALKETAYPFSDIASIVTARCYEAGGREAGQIYCDARYVVRFKNGDHWAPMDDTLGSSLEKSLSAKSGIPITVIPLVSLPSGENGGISSTNMLASDTAFRIRAEQLLPTKSGEAAREWMFLAKASRQLKQ